MARLIFNRAAVTAAGVASSTDATKISGIVTDSITISEEMLSVVIENNQNMTEGYTTTMSFRTINDKFDDGTTALDDASSKIYFGGTGTLAKGRLYMYGSTTGGDDFYVDDVYIMGRRVFENGREEYEISCQIDTTSAKIVKA